MHGSVQSVCKCFFGDGGRGRCPPGKQALPVGMRPYSLCSRRGGVPKDGLCPSGSQGGYSLLKENVPPPGPPKEKRGDATLHRHGNTIPGPAGPPIVPFPRKRAALSATGGAWPAFPTPLLAQRGGLRPSPLETPPGQGGARYRLPCRPQTHLPAAPKDVPHRIAFPHLGARCSPGCK